MTKSSEQRIKAFVDWFIRSEYVSNWTSEKDSDFINESERAERCYKAAEFGGDGKTHAEVIEDWREAFAAYIRDKRLWSEPERFVAGVTAHFDAVEQWHSEHGTLYQEIG
jgi:hypothetical protein